MTFSLTAGLVAAALVAAPVPGTAAPSTAKPADQVRFTDVGGQAAYSVRGQDRNHFRAFSGPDGQVHIVPAHGAKPAPFAAVDRREVLHPVRVEAIGLDGGPAQPFAFLVNTDSFATAEVLLSFDDNGIAQTEVPAGHYLVYLVDGLDTTVQLVLDDLVVAATGTTTITADERTATSPVTVTAPRPAVTDHSGLIVVRTDATGALWTMNVFVPGFDRVLVNPAPAPRIGSRSVILKWAAVSPDRSPNYTYDAAFRTDGAIPADQHHVVRPDQVATVHPTFHHSPGEPAPGPGDQAMLLSDPLLDRLPGTPAITMPVDFTGLTQYLGTADGGRWTQAVYPTPELGLRTATTTYRPGHDYPIAWGPGPIAPSALSRSGRFENCEFCVAGDTLVFFGGRLADGDRAQQGVLVGPPTAQHYTVTRDGVQVYDTTDVHRQPGDVVTGLPTGAATYRFDYDLDLTGKAGFGQSTTSHTEITAHYDPASPAVPGPYACSGSPEPCRPLPVLALRYHLAGLDETNTTTAATQTLTVDVAHYRINGVGSSSPITAVTVEVSFDGGTTWRAMPVTGVGAHRVTHWANSLGAKGSSPWLRTTATDRAGNRITQTIASVYTIAAPVRSAARSGAPVS